MQQSVLLHSSQPRTWRVGRPQIQLPSVVTHLRSQQLLDLRCLLELDNGRHVREGVTTTVERVTNGLLSPFSWRPYLNHTRGYPYFGEESPCSKLLYTLILCVIWVWILVPSSIYFRLRPLVSTGRWLLLYLNHNLRDIREFKTPTIPVTVSSIDHNEWIDNLKILDVVGPFSTPGAPSTVSHTKRRKNRRVGRFYSGGRVFLVPKLLPYLLFPEGDTDPGWGGSCWLRHVPFPSLSPFSLSVRSIFFFLPLFYLFRSPLRFPRNYRENGVLLETGVPSDPDRLERETDGGEQSRKGLLSVLTGMWE